MLPDGFASSARELLEGAIAARVTPGAVLKVATREVTLPPVVAGARSYGGASVGVSTRYDLASLTKVIACLPVLLHLLEAGEVSLNDKVSRFFSNAGWFQDPSLGDVSVEELALHSSGLPAWTPMFAWVNDRLTATANALQTPLSGTRGQYDYSDLGVMVLGAICERVTGERLDALTQRLVLGPLGMDTAGFGPLEPGSDVAATEDDGWRGRVLMGEVHDENAWAMGGVSAHAGLFGTAGDVVKYASSWLRTDTPFAGADWLAEAVRDRSRGAGPPRGLLWRLNSDNWPIGEKASPSTFGHTGFTGTSLVVDPEAGWACVLLTNRVHPRRGDTAGIVGLRRSVHRLVSETFGAAG